MSSGFWDGLFGQSPAKLLVKSQELIAKARQKFESSPKEALKNLDKAIEILSKPALEGNQALLGSALLFRGKLEETGGNRAAALESYLHAKQVLPSVPPPVLSFIGASLAATGDLKPAAIGIYLELVRALRDQARPPETGVVYALLEKHCATDEKTGATDYAEKLARLQKAVDADPKLEWAHYYTGLVHFSRRRYPDALAAFQRAVALQSPKPLLGYCVAFCNGKRGAKLGRAAAAIESFRQAAKLAPERPEPEFEAGRLLVDLTRKASGENPDRARWLQEGSQSLERAVRLDPKQAEYAFYLGWAYQLADRTAEATHCLVHAIQLDQTRAEYFLHLGQCRQRLGEFQEAQAAARSALALDKQYGDAYRLLAESCLAVQDFPQAAEAFQVVVASNPEDAEARSSLGLALYSTNRFEDAVRALKPAQAASDAAAFRLARCYAKLDRFDQAAEILAGLAPKQPSNVSILYYLALAYAHLGRLEESLKAFDQAIRTSGSQANLHFHRGNVYAKLGRHAEAAADYRTALGLLPDDPQVLFQLGCLCVQTGDEEDAISYLARAVLLQPTHLPARLALGAVHEKREAFREALSDFAAAAKLAPKDPQIRLRLGVLRCRVEQYDKALVQLREAAELADDSDELLYFLGFAASRSKDFAAAIGAWEKLQARHPEDSRVALNLNRLHYALGKQHIGEGRFQEAIAEWTLYLQPRPDDEQMKQEIAKLHFRVALGAFNRDGKAAPAPAREALERAVALDTENPVYHYYLALCDALEGRWGAFTAAAQSLLPQLDPSLQPVARRHLGIACLAQNDLAAAEQFLTQALAEAAPAAASADVCWPLAIVHAKSGRWAEAADQLDGKIDLEAGEERRGSTVAGKESRARTHSTIRGAGEETR
jgi:tetratricopeptide (TPR) repeat protein